MKKAIIGTTGLAAVSTVVIVAVRRFGPDLAERGIRKCHEMMARITEQSEPSLQLTGDCAEGHQGVPEKPSRSRRPGLGVRESWRHGEFGRHRAGPQALPSS
jgi:hypothetical protein